MTEEELELIKYAEQEAENLRIEIRDKYGIVLPPYLKIIKEDR